VEGVNVETFQKFIKFILKSFIVGSAFSLKNIFVIATWSMANNDWLTSAVLVFAAIIGALLKLFIVYGGSMILISMGLVVLYRVKINSWTEHVVSFYPLGIAGLLNFVLYLMEASFLLREIVMLIGWICSYFLLARSISNGLVEKLPLGLHINVALSGVLMLFIFPPVP